MNALGIFGLEQEYLRSDGRIRISYRGNNSLLMGIGVLEMKPAGQITVLTLQQERIISYGVLRLPTERLMALSGANKAHSEMFPHDHNLLHTEANWVKG